MTEFQVGDIVDCSGTVGKITNIFGDLSRPLEVCFQIKGNEEYFYYTIDGKFSKEQTTPDLTLVSRPNNKVKKILRGWVLVNPYPVDKNLGTSIIYPTKESAHDERKSYGEEYVKKLIIVEVTGEYEIDDPEH